MKKKLYTYCLRQGDNGLILGHRLSEYCSRGPFLEEDLAISNVSLDLYGQSESFLQYAAELGSALDADELVFKRAETDFCNVKLVELPNEDFAHIMARQFYMDVFNYHFCQALKNSSDEKLAAIAAKSLKEVTYHLRRSAEWMKRLGDGTEESHRRIQEALDEKWTYTGELFISDEIEEALIAEGIAVDVSTILPKWLAMVKEVLNEATLEMPSSEFMQAPGRYGHHTEHMGYILTDMQYLNRAYPDAKW